MTHTPMLPLSATPLPHRGKSLWSFAALYAFAKPPQNPPKTRMNSAILNSRVLLRLYKHGNAMLHTNYSNNSLHKKKAPDFTRKM